MKSLSYDDILLEPQYSEITSRKNIDLSSRLDFEITLDIPLMSSPMDTVTEDQMAVSMAQRGGLGVIHRYNTIDEQVNIFKKCMLSYGGNIANSYACAIGVTEDYLERAWALREVGCKILCLDVAHGHHLLVKRAIHNLKLEMPNVHIMAGNVASAKGYSDLAFWGADSVRIGVGGGSICSTRIQTGHGIPTFQAVRDCQAEKVKMRLENHPVIPIIADGGIKNSGDIVKALAAGANFVMLGSLLAGTDEAPGKEKLEYYRRGPYGQTHHLPKPVRKKLYRGMASKEAQKDWKGTYSSDEGVETWIDAKGPVAYIIKSLVGGVRSGLSYSGARNIDDLQEKAVFKLQSPLGALESSTHIMK